MGFFKRLYDRISSPGRQKSVECTAPTQFKSWGSRFFDAVTNAAGARVTFTLTLLILVGWAVAGGILGAPDVWQIIMQDGSSIQCYISDTLLMRQQQIHTHTLLTILATLRSRLGTFSRLLHSDEIARNNSVTAEKIRDLEIQDTVGDAVKLPDESFFDRMCNFVSDAVGSFYCLVAYTAGVIVWVCFGPSLGFSDVWQLYINTAVAVELTFTSMFLQNTRRRHLEYLERCVDHIMKVDGELEVLLRQSARDNEPNHMVIIEPTPVHWGMRAIDYYGDIVGTGAGVFISCCVFATWIAVGNSMEWNDNWWLIIGTYTGLVGFIDGFVLRNVYFRQDVILDNQFDLIQEADESIYQYLDIPLPTKPLEEKHNLITRFSFWMSWMLSKSIAVLVGIIIVIGLIIIASLMHWSQTGQLICNTPTMIIEGFLLIVLIQAHNNSNVRRRIQLHDIYLRRLKLSQYVDATAVDGFSKEKE
ncbi:Low affinity iron permease-domain-containing protein [Pilobolus umbonatus]|nr:Low affinity iron permease-domain-containing protein [Pilobolus umbonatus]